MAKRYKAYVYGASEETGMPNGFEVRIYQNLTNYIADTWDDGINLAGHGITINSPGEYRRLCIKEQCGGHCFQRTIVSVWFGKNSTREQRAFVLGHEIGHTLTNQENRETQADQYGTVAQMVIQLLDFIRA